VIHYTIQPIDPNAHLFAITVTVPEPAAEGQLLSLPAWIPGSYMIRDFARNIVRLDAEDAGGPLAVQKVDKQTWRLGRTSGAVLVHYQVYAWDLSVRSAHLDATHGYFNGTSVFLRVHGRDDAPCSVEIRPPEGDGFWDWEVATTLPADGAEPRGFGRYRARDYDELVDHPVEMGTFTVLEFEARGVPHEVVITGRFRADTERLVEDVRRVCEHHIDFFGGTAPFEHYLFLLTVVGDGYGGLEHRNSCSLMCRRDALPLPGRPEVSDGYRDLLGLFSHEYFHAWNVKRIKPAVFQPYDLGREVHTTLLWAFEGFTSYYDELALRRAGLISEESYLELLGRTITRLLRTPGRHSQSVTDSSFDAWTKFYKQDENGPNAIVSYYIKGAVIALALDLTLLGESDGERSLDDVMRALWEEFGARGVGIGERELERFIAARTGLDLDQFFEQALYGTEEIALEPLFETLGVEMHRRPAESATDRGGKAPAHNSGELLRRGYLGVRSTEDPAGARLATVFSDTPAHRAGLSAGDVVIAVDGLRVGTGNTLEKQLATCAPGTETVVHAFRRDELMRFEVTLGAPPEETCYLTLAESPTPQARRLQAQWLGGGTTG